MQRFLKATQAIHWPMGPLAAAGLILATLSSQMSIAADIAATHIYHNHMPNFWPYYDLQSYKHATVGSPIRYFYDGQVAAEKANPRPGWPHLPTGEPMPHDALDSAGGYYSHHAKWGAYLYWPWRVADQLHGQHSLGQAHVTMSAAVINNVQSLTQSPLPAFGSYAEQPQWGDPWRQSHIENRTSNGHPTLDLIHFSGHHSLAPLVGRDYLLKDLIYHNATLAQDYFLGKSLQSSKGFFPTELGFSERLIPTLRRLGIEWSVVGNIHLSRTLEDYPYLNQPGMDTMVSPPNRADLQNPAQTGQWVSQQMFNEKQVTHNHFPFAAIPHWAEYVDPNNGESMRLAVIPVEQASSWEEAYQGEVRADVLKEFTDIAAKSHRKQFFVIAHDGDNSSGRAGSEQTWLNAARVTYADTDVDAMGVDEYLQHHPIPDHDLVHVQDGSWIDTRDSSGDPSWYHWHLPFGLWSGQLYDFNRIHGFQFPVRKNWQGQALQYMVSLEYGYHYLERNYALLQAALNYAKTAEQIWLDEHPQHWQPSSALDEQISYPGNQLNPWMYSYPIKGDASQDYAGGANPAELAWYFLLPALDSGFGYYDENVDDHLKPTLSFNQSLAFSKPYVDSKSQKDRTGPSLWWPQRYPYNPGSANVSKAEGWATVYMNQSFAIYTYAYDMNQIKRIELKIRQHKQKRADPWDKTYQVYDPASLKDDPRIDPSRVSTWQSFPLRKRSLQTQINQVDWQPNFSAGTKIVGATKIADLYYTYLDKYQDVLLDYYIEAEDKLGNISRSDIQQVYVGAGRYREDQDGHLVEDPDGPIAGYEPFFTRYPPKVDLSVYLPKNHRFTNPKLYWWSESKNSWQVFSDLKSASANYLRARQSLPIGKKSVVFELRSQNQAARRFDLSQGTWQLSDAGKLSAGLPSDISLQAKIVYFSPFATPPYIHFELDGDWTPLPGQAMVAADKKGWYEIELSLGRQDHFQAVFTDGQGNWDTQGGSNYRFSSGTYQVHKQKISPH